MLPLVYHPAYSFPFDEKHRFAMSKFGRLFAYLNQRGLVDPSQLYRPAKAKASLIALAHDAAYVSQFIEGTLPFKAMREIGLPWSAQLVERSLISPVGTLLTAQLALRHGLACHVAGGTHHAHYDHGRGFCVFNDLAIAAKSLVKQGLAERVLIFDCDVHQGDGTARILADDSSVFTCSVHCKQNYPARKALSDLDVEVEKGAADEVYLLAVHDAMAQCAASFSPDLVIFDAGVDVFAGDRLGLLDVSMEGIRIRDESVLRFWRGRGVPVATVIGGGYDHDHAALAERHGSIFETAVQLKSDGVV
ncbi:MAG: histone deacetylase [Gammaproteobacteria bacterium]|nr:histone deacetylase [Gammaproteobacteria bacterium]